MWPEGRTEASGHTRRQNLATPNLMLSLCKIIGVKSDNCVKHWFWLGFKDSFSWVSNFIHSVGPLGNVLWILDSYLREPFIKPQVFYVILSCLFRTLIIHFGMWKLRQCWISCFNIYTHIYMYFLYTLFSYVLKENSRKYFPL